MKHTPGPWWRREAPHDNEIVAKDNGGLAVRRAVAWGRDDEEIEANALLISAAPDLLAACESLLELVREYQPVVLGESDQAHKDRTIRANAIAAINKALGK